MQDQNIKNMANMTEKQRWQAQDDAYTMARYQEIMADKARASRAVKFVSNQANQMQKQAKAMASAIKKSPTSKRK